MEGPQNLLPSRRLANQEYATIQHAVGENCIRRMLFEGTAIECFERSFQVLKRFARGRNLYCTTDLIVPLCGRRLGNRFASLRSAVLPWRVPAAP